MSAFLPRVGRGEAPHPEHPSLQQRPLTRADREARWEVRAAQWRAHELAERIFGRVGGSSLIGIGRDGDIRGLLDLQVPFVDLRSHRCREDRFMAAVRCDPVLSRVPLVYVIGPELA